LTSRGRGTKSESELYTNHGQPNSYYPFPTSIAPDSPPLLSQKEIIIKKVKGEQRT